MYASVVRTVVPIVAAFLIVQAAKLGITLPDGALTEVVTAVVAGVYYTLARLVEQHVQPTLGRILLSAGLTGKAPLYVQERANAGHEANTAP